MDIGMVLITVVSTTILGLLFVINSLRGEAEPPQELRLMLDEPEVEPAPAR